MHVPWILFLLNMINIIQWNCEVGKLCLKKLLKKTEKKTKTDAAVAEVNSSDKELKNSSFWSHP